MGKGDHFDNKCKDGNRPDLSQLGGNNLYSGYVPYVVNNDIIHNAALHTTTVSNTGYENAAADNTTSSSSRQRHASDGHVYHQTKQQSQPDPNRRRHLSNDQYIIPTPYPYIEDRIGKGRYPVEQLEILLQDDKLLRYKDHKDIDRESDSISSSLDDDEGSKSNLRAFITLAILLFANLLNYMDRYTIAGEAFICVHVHLD